MRLLHNIAAEAEPLQVPVSELIRRIKRRRRIAVGSGAVAVLLIALTATVLSRPAPEVVIPIGEPPSPAASYNRDSPFSCGQILSDLDQWAKTKRDDAMILITRPGGDRQPLVSVGFRKEPAPKLVQIVLVRKGVVVGHSVSLAIGADGGTSTSRGVTHALCPSHSWQAAWSGDDYELVVLGAESEVDPSPVLVARGVLKRSIAMSTPDTMMIRTYCEGHGAQHLGLMHQGHWWKISSSIDEYSWDNGQIGQFKIVVQGEIEFTTPAGLKATFHKTSHPTEQAQPCLF